jgi:3-oxoacyl-[acyl-carrier protein] reductase
MDIKKAVAVVTGSSSVTGVGSECVKILAKNGCKVVINYATNKDGAEETAKICRDAGGEVITVKGNVAIDEDCKGLVKAALDKWGRLDILVNNAATTKPISHKKMDELDIDEWTRVLGVNLIGNYLMTRAAAPHLKATGDGAIINISSTGAWQARGSSIAYCASKGGVNTMTMSMARIMAPEVRVNTLCPGGVLGNNWTRKILKTEEEYQKRVEAAKTKFPLARPVWPADVADAAYWLIVGARSMTGETIRLDAGQHLL